MKRLTLLLTLFVYLKFWMVASKGLRIGTGMADVTGLCGDILMMGYAEITQKANGIHMRLKSRAFIFDDESQRIVYVVVDAAIVSYFVKRQVIKRLAHIYGSNVYTEDNVCLAATHSHSAPGGDLDLIIYQLAHYGFNDEKANNVISGIVESITKAHESLQPGSYQLASDYLRGANINRSPTAYRLNPLAERDYYGEDTDNMMTLLRLRSTSGIDLGLIDWFSVHPTSLNNTNHLISGDNKGIASYIFERHGPHNNRGKFLAAFPQAPAGDSSPNTLGAFCIDSGTPCIEDPSVCEGDIPQCHGRGPGFQHGDMESNRMIGKMQASKAFELFNKLDDINAGSAFRGQFEMESSYHFRPEELLAQPEYTGIIGHKSLFVNMTNIMMAQGPASFNATCKPAMGYSFAAGTIDGPGLSFFFQGDKSESHYFWDVLRNLLREPSIEQLRCHFPKPILLSGGEIKIPYDWLPEVLQFQIFRLDSIFLLATSFEISTMASRRLRGALRKLLLPHFNDPVILITTLANGYASYLTTFEEYQAQRYEGSSNLFGPHTLEACIKIFLKLTKALIEDSELYSNAEIPDFSDRFIHLNGKVQADQLPFGGKYGQVLQQPEMEYTIGSTVVVKFQGCHPSNNFSKVKSFLTIEKLENSRSGLTKWTTIYDDDDDCTIFEWCYTSLIWNISETTLRWTIPHDTAPGKYRIKYHGYRRKRYDNYIPISGTSQAFFVSYD